MESSHHPSSPDGGWTECLDAARSGCPISLGRLLERFRPALLSIATRDSDRDLRSKAGASDLVQDSLLEGQLGFHTFRGERPEEMLAWLMQILAHNQANFRRRFRNTAKRTVRREQTLATCCHVDLPAPEANRPEEKIVRQEALAQLQEAINSLPKIARIIVVLRQREGLSFEAIGLRTGRTPQSVRQIWWRAIHQLRNQLAKPE